MGEHATVQGSDDARRGLFMKSVITDFHVLEQMLKLGLIESGIERIGAEQEMFLVDREAQPSCVASQILKRIGDPRFTTEIARFNLEANATPLLFSGGCLAALEMELNEMVSAAARTANELGTRILLTGILPTLKQSDLTLANLTDSPRYHQLNRAVTHYREDKLFIHIKGIDEVHITHDNVMLEACNSSFQVHLQVSPSEFANRYNLAQIITAPVLAAAVNSPVLFGKRLWSETRLALFQHSVDERSPAQKARFRPPRVSFGESWIRESVLEIYREDISRFPVIMTQEIGEDPEAVLAAGKIPNLSALRLHNGTIWRWNRPCYGILNGQAHLRIENRSLPAGPTILDEMANAAFFLGLMSSCFQEYGPVDRVMEFDNAKANFFAAARHGLNAQFSWVNGKSISARDLILEELIPLALQGLRKVDVPSEDVDRYLHVIEERVRSGQNGAQWTTKALTALKNYPGESHRLRELTETMLTRSSEEKPVHLWPIPDVVSTKNWKYRTVDQLMSTDLFTVRPYDVVNLAASIMDWEHIRHVPVEDDHGNLVGLITHRDLLKLLAKSTSMNLLTSVPVHSLMKTDLITVCPEETTLEAILLMREKKVGCLPVVQDKKLVGIITVYDLLSVSAQLLEESLKE